MSLYAYFCPVCASVEILATRSVGKYHKAPTFHGFRTHAMLEAGTFASDVPLEQIKAQVLANDWAGGVREIEVVSKELHKGQVKRERARQPRMRVRRKVRT